MLTVRRAGARAIRSHSSLASVVGRSGSAVEYFDALGRELLHSPTSIEAGDL